MIEDKVLNNAVEHITLFQYLQLFLISTSFGLASYLFKLRQQKIKFTIYSLGTEIFFSLLSSYLSFRLCLHFGIDGDLISVFVGMAAWSGSKFMTIMDKVITMVLIKKFHLDPKEVEKIEKDLEQ